MVMITNPNPPPILIESVCELLSLAIDLILFFSEKMIMALVIKMFKVKQNKAGSIQLKEVINY